MDLDLRTFTYMLVMLYFEEEEEREKSTRSHAFLTAAGKMAGALAAADRLGLAQSEVQIQCAFMDAIEELGPRPPYEVSRNLARKKYDLALMRLVMKAMGWKSPRYVARSTKLGRNTHVVIYDRDDRSYPAFLGDLVVPQGFPTMEAAQAWADEHLNIRD